MVVLHSERQWRSQGLHLLAVWVNVRHVEENFEKGILSVFSCFVQKIFNSFLPVSITKTHGIEY